MIQYQVNELIKENERLRLMNMYSKPIKGGDSFQKLYQDYMEIKRNINELELIHEKNLKIVNAMEEKSLGNRMNSEKNDYSQEKIEFKTKAELDYSKLRRKYNLLYKLYISHVMNFEKKVKELEKIDKNLMQSRTCLQMKLLKMKQQERLLEVAESQIVSSKVRKHYTEARFLYKPSIKNLYN